MAREIVAFCDNHETGQGVPGTTRQLDLGTGPRQLELCDDCWAELAEDLEKLVQNHGRDVGDQDGSRKLKLRCPWCPMSLASPRNLRDHVDTKHPESAADFVAGLIQRHEPSAKGVKFVDDLPRITRRTESRTCEECGQICGSPQGLGAHLRAAHGIEGSSPSTLSNRAKKGMR